MHKRVSNKVVIMSIIIVIILIVLYFLIFVVDIFGYIKNYDYLQDAGTRAKELHNEIEQTSNESNKHRAEYQEKKNTLENIINNSK